MLGWMDDEALHRTLTTGRGTYWSRSRQEYWVKGETSGHTQRVVEVRLDCDGDTAAGHGRPDRPRLPHRRPHLLRRRRCCRAEEPDPWLTPDAGRRRRGAAACGARDAARPRARRAGRRRARAKPWIGARHDRRRRRRLDDGARQPARATRWPRRSAWCCSRRGACCWSPAAGVRRAFARARRRSPRSGCVATRRRRRTSPCPDQRRRRLATLLLGRARRRHRLHRLVLDRGRGRGLSRWSRRVVAVRLVPAWPEMGSAVRRPGAHAAAPPASEPAETEQELWKALDEGRDPTDRPSPEPVGPPRDRGRPTRTGARRPDHADPATRGAPCPTTTATPRRPGRP